MITETRETLALTAGVFRWVDQCAVTYLKATSPKTRILTVAIDLVAEGVDHPEGTGGSPRSHDGSLGVTVQAGTGP